jgi:hypothetical protein
MLLTKKIDGVWRQIDERGSGYYADDVNVVGRAYDRDGADESDSGLYAADEGQFDPYVPQVVDGGPEFWTGPRGPRSDLTEGDLPPLDHDPAYPPPDGLLFDEKDPYRQLGASANLSWKDLLDGSPLRDFRKRVALKAPVDNIGSAVDRNDDASSLETNIRRSHGPYWGTINGGSRPKTENAVFEPYATLLEWGEAYEASAFLDCLRLLGLPRSIEAKAA